MLYASCLLHTITKAVARPNGRKLRRQERSLQIVVQKRLNEQKAYVIKKAKPLFNNKSISLKGIDSDIDKILDNIPDQEMIDDIIAFEGGTMAFGAAYRIRKMKLGGFGISFDLTNDLAVKYLETDRPLVLAKMTNTVKEHIKPILSRAAETGAAYTETAAIISENYAFSKTRSLMIAVNEVGHAYEAGNIIPMVDMWKAGHKVRKWWITVNDDRVTDECAANQGEGEIDLMEEFLSGDAESPRNDHPRCRCTMGYDFD